MGVGWKASRYGMIQAFATESPLFITQIPDMLAQCSRYARCHEGRSLRCEPHWETAGSLSGMLWILVKKDDHLRGNRSALYSAKYRFSN